MSRTSSSLRARSRSRCSSSATVAPADRRQRLLGEALAERRRRPAAGSARPRASASRRAATSACSVSGMSSSSPSVADDAVGLAGLLEHTAVGQHPDRLDRIERDRPRPAPRCRARPAAGSPSTSPVTSSRIASSGSGSRCSDDDVPEPAPQSGRRSSSSGRARATTRIGDVARPARAVTRRSRAGPGRPTAGPRTTRTTVPASATRSKKRRHAANSSSRSPGGARRGRAGGQARLDPAALVLVGDVVVERRGEPRPRGRRSSSVSAMPARLRTISASAQNATPSPYDGQRPWCQKMVSARPSTYFCSSHSSRRLADAGRRR